MGSIAGEGGVAIETLVDDRGGAPRGRSGPRGSKTPRGVKNPDFDQKRDFGGRTPKIGGLAKIPILGGGAKSPLGVKTPILGGPPGGVQNPLGSLGG